MIDNFKTRILGQQWIHYVKGMKDINTSQIKIHPSKT